MFYRAATVGEVSSATTSASAAKRQPGKAFFGAFFCLARLQRSHSWRTKGPYPGLRGRKPDALTGKPAQPALQRDWREQRSKVTARNTPSGIQVGPLEEESVPRGRAGWQEGSCRMAGRVVRHPLACLFPKPKETKNGCRIRSCGLCPLERHHGSQQGKNGPEEGAGDSGST